MTRHCTGCGSPTQALEGTPHYSCPNCKQVDHVNPAPAVGIAILRDGKVLLAKRAHEPKQGEWDLVGGFVDAGETVPEAARREAMEETGLTLTRLRRLHQAPGEYLPGQPTLNFVYVAEAEGDPEARDDVAAVQWAALDDLPPLAWPHEADALQRLSKTL